MKESRSILSIHNQAVGILPAGSEILDFPLNILYQEIGDWTNVLTMNSSAGVSKSRTFVPRFPQSAISITFLPVPGPFNKMHRRGLHR